MVHGDLAGRMEERERGGDRKKRGMETRENGEGETENVGREKGEKVKGEGREGGERMDKDNPCTPSPLHLNIYNYV